MLRRGLFIEDKMHRIHRPILILFGILAHLAGPSGHCTEKAPSVVTYRTLSTPRGAFKFKLIRFWNEHHERELVVIHEEMRKLMPMLEVPVLYGRALGGGKRLDAWFIPTGPATLEAVDRLSKEEDGWDVASDILAHTIKIHNRPTYSLLLQAVQRKMTINGSMAIGAFEEFVRTEMDLEDLELRADRMSALDPRSPEAKEAYRLVHEGWDRLIKKVDSEGKAQRIGALADIATFGAIFRRLRVRDLARP